MRVSLLLSAFFIHACTPVAARVSVGLPDGGADVPAATADVVVAPADVPAGSDVTVAPGDAPPGVDVPSVTLPDVVTPPSDAPAVACMSDRACGGATPRCDRAQGRCAACVTNAHCPEGSVCGGGRCVAATACVSSRTCPGQVCDPALMRCVDCASTNDCTGGAVCQDGACLPPPRACVSSRECSALDQVCDTARMLCVDCVGTNDCATTEYCAAGVCRSRACGGGRADCDENPNNGCEADLQTSAAHCGACGRACASTTSTLGACVAGACQRTCAAGFGDCDGDANNGCETSTRASNAHCGACGRPCATGSSCVAGSCAATPVTPAQLTVGRMGAGVVRYPDGRVLVIGGLSDDVSISSTTVYEPVPNRWIAGPTLPEPLNGPAAVLARDGRVFLFGGLGFNTFTPSTSVYVLPTIGGAWTRAGTLPVARYGATAVVVGSSIWVLGGLNTSISSTNRVEVYDPNTQGFSAGAPMNTGRGYFASAQTPDGRLWAFGGLITGDTTTAASEVYDPASGRWSALAAMPTPLGGGGSLLASDGRLYVVGGFATTGYTNATLSFDFTAQRWSTGPTLPLARGFGSLAEAPNGVLLYFGGRDLNMLGLTNVWAYTLGSTAWR